jgi:UDP-N-acetyl-D-mannosaminuronic acid transferase (WecB/TagA/CpsF family)
MDSEILGTRINPTRLDTVVSRTMEWSHSGDTHYVCVANVHMVNVCQW